MQGVEMHDDILECVGQTPLVRLRRFCREPPVLAAKIEYFNPGASVKDRIGLALIEAGEREGLLSPGGTIVEPTSGNTGLGLAMAAVLKDLGREGRTARGARRRGRHLSHRGRSG
jgi:cysteine synthase